MPQVDIDNVHSVYHGVCSIWSSLRNMVHLFNVGKKGSSTGLGNGKLRDLPFFLPTVLLFIVSILKMGSFYEGNWVFGVFIYIVTTNLCAFHITDSLNEELSLKFDEFVVINLLLGNAALALTYVYLTVLMPTVTGFHLLFALALFSLATCIASIVLLKNRRIEQKLDPTRVSLQIAGLLLCFLFGFWIISKAIPLEYWRGEDPWGLAVVSRGILENSLSPLEAFNYYRSHFAIYTSGFYSYVAAILLITGCSVESVVRYGGVVIAGTLSMITYVTVKRLLNPLGGLFAVTFLFMNSYMVTRLVSPLREYFSFLYLILFLLLPQLRKMEGKDRLHYAYIFVSGVLLSIIIINHALVTIIVMSVLGYYFLQFIIKKQYTLSMELVYIILFGFILSWPYYTLIHRPFIEFLSTNNANMIIIVSIFFLAIFSGIIIFKLNSKYDLIALFTPKVKLILLVLSGLVVFINVYYQPNLGSSYEYSYIYTNYFSRTIIPLTIVGLFFISYSSASSVILFLFILISGFTGLSYLGIQVPLGRLSIYLMWVMSFISGYVMSKVANSDNFFVIPKTIEELKMSVAKSRLFLSKNGIYFVLLAVILFSCYKEVNDVYRRPTLFNEFDVESARSFAQMVLPDDLVIHHQRLHILLYYAGVTPDNMIRSDDPWIWQSKLINASTVYEFSDIVRSEYSNVKRVHFVTDYNFYNLFDDDTPLKSFLPDYAEEKLVGSLLVFTLNIPFDLSMTPLSKIRFIEAVGPDPVVPNGGPGEWDQYIKNPSNVVYDSSDSDKLFKVYFSGCGEDDSDRLGAAYSKDGVNWSKNPHTLTPYGYDDPYVVAVNGKYYLYAVNTLEKDIVRLESHDGLDWCNETVVVKQRIGCDYWSYESPVVWFNCTWNMIYTETVICDDEQKCGLVYLSSPNGLEWNIENPDIKWALQNNGIRYEYSKILLSDLILCDEGSLFFGKFEAENENRDMLWRTGSFLVCDVNNPNVEFRSLNYKALANSSSCVDSIQIFINPTINQTLFLYSDNSKPEYSSLTGGLSLGTIGDNIGLSNRSIIIP